MSETNGETLEQFRKSFGYGTRTDLLFKFMASKNFTDQEAGEFIRGLLEELGVAFDTGDQARVMQYVYEWQVRGYSPRGEVEDGFTYDTIPWAPLAKPLSASRVAMISAGGLFVEGDDPMGPDGPSQDEMIPRVMELFRKAPTLSTIPVNTPHHRMRVRHPGYDIRGSTRDHNVVFPIDRLKELHSEGVVGELAGENYSFVGATSQKRLLLESAPVWARELLSGGVDVALLVAA